MGLRPLGPEPKADFSSRTSSRCMDAATGLGGAQFRGNFGTAIGVEEVKGKIERRRAAVVKDKRHRTLSAAEGSRWGR